MKRRACPASTRIFHAGAVGASRDVFYTLPYRCIVSYPATGYVNAVPLLGHSILQEEPYRQGHLQDFPESCAMLYEFSWLGGGTIKSVWDQALADPTRAVAVAALGSPPFESLVIQVDTLTTPQSGP